LQAGGCGVISCYFQGDDKTVQEEAFRKLVFFSSTMASTAKMMQEQQMGMPRDHSNDSRSPSSWLPIQTSRTSSVCLCYVNQWLVKRILENQMEIVGHQGYQQMQRKLGYLSGVRWPRYQARVNCFFRDSPINGCLYIYFILHIPRMIITFCKPFKDLILYKNFEFLGRSKDSLGNH
jgi:hypothetical protein